MTQAVEKTHETLYVEGEEPYTCRQGQLDSGKGIRDVLIRFSGCAGN